MAAAGLSAVDIAIGVLTLDERLWLGPNYTWSGLHDESNGSLKPQFWHFQYVALFTVLALMVRALLDRILFSPLGLMLGVSSAPPAPPPANRACEELYKSAKRPSREHVQSAAAALGWTEERVMRWLKRRKASADRGKMPKFQEASWRFLGYASLLVFGVWALKDTEYIMDTYKCWTNYPHEGIPTRVFWYYMLELAYYTSLTVSHFTDTKRKDFWEMLIHHIATLALITFSFICKHIAIGSLIMFVHDIADPWLELAKALGYTRVKARSDGGRTWAQIAVEVCFVIFAISFWITRLYVYPRFLIYSVWVESEQAMGPWPFKYAFLALLITLFFLHIFWSYMIIQVVTRAFREGQVGGDSRSDDEGDGVLDENEDEPVVTKQRPNGQPPAVSGGGAADQETRQRTVPVDRKNGLH
ncbi:ceramide synthase 6-like [Sycon ciliatum]|uniref:ceramide synthase 6-like n=1 Tax=Sycon ciliatum TaxID=27933 RepID=UPI0031F62246